MQFKWLFSYFGYNFDVTIDSIELTETQSNYTFLLASLLLFSLLILHITNWYSWVHLFRRNSSSTHFLSLFFPVLIFYYRLCDNTGSTIHMTKAQFFFFTFSKQIQLSDSFFYNFLTLYLPFFTSFQKEASSPTMTREKNNNKHF